jgi:hypothetical protein
MFSGTGILVLGYISLASGHRIAETEEKDISPPPVCSAWKTLSVDSYEWDLLVASLQPLPLIS